MVTCPFCGGIGAGLNGTLSGNLNLKYSLSSAAEMDISLVNGIYTNNVNEYKWDDMVFMKMWTNEKKEIDPQKIITFVN